MDLAASRYRIVARRPAGPGKGKIPATCSHSACDMVSGIIPVPAGLSSSPGLITAAFLLPWLTRGASVLSLVLHVFSL
jgi:peptidyl-tRNA hydrolase